MALQTVVEGWKAAAWCKYAWPAPLDTVLAGNTRITWQTNRQCDLTFKCPPCVHSLSTRCPLFVHSFVANCSIMDPQFPNHSSQPLMGLTDSDMSIDVVNHPHQPLMSSSPGCTLPSNLSVSLSMEEETSSSKSKKHQSGISQNPINSSSLSVPNFYNLFVF